MKKILLFAAIAALSVIASCQKEETPVQNETKPILFSASIAAPSDTKVSVDMNDGKVSWVAGDKITISDGANTGVYKANSSGASTDFTYESGTEFTAAGDYTATYGTMPAAGVDQLYDATPGKLIHMSAPKVTTTDAATAANFKFTADCGLLKLNLMASGKNIKRIYVSDGTNTYKLLCETAQSIDGTAKDFYIALPAGSYTKYIIRDSDGNEAVKTAKSGNATSIAANTISRVTFSSLTFVAPIYPESSTAGTKIGSTWWAPVNCGYEPATVDPAYKGYPYGKLYQWGRKYGQGYCKDTYEDADYPGKSGSTSIIADMWTGSNGAEAPLTFYKKGTGSTKTKDWIQSGDDTYWNTGTEEAPVRTDHDPCPAGWRVPTYAELNALTGNNGGTSIGGAGWDATKKGYWFNGTTFPSSGNGLFLPAAGYRSLPDGTASGRGSGGHYWSSSVDDLKAWSLYFYSAGANMSSVYRANGYSVRCVQE